MLQTLSLFTIPILVGGLMAIACALLGVFVLTKRVVFIGATLSQVAACGIAAGLFFHLPPVVGAIVLTVPIALLLSLPYESSRVPRDTVLGVIFVGAAAFTILIVSKSASELQQIKAIMAGNLLFASRSDFFVTLGLLLPSILGFLLFLRPILFSFLDRDAAKVAGVRVALWEVVYFLGLALVVSASSKIVGALLTFCFLVLGPAVGLLLGRQIWQVFSISCLFSLAMTFGGMSLSYSWDLPTSHTIAGLGVLLLVSIASIKALSRKLLSPSKRT